MSNKLCIKWINYNKINFFWSKVMVILEFNGKKLNVFFLRFRVLEICIFLLFLLNVVYIDLIKERRRLKVKR